MKYRLASVTLLLSTIFCVPVAGATNAFGESGLLLVPDARMDTAGTIRLGSHEQAPWRHYALGWQAGSRVNARLRFTDQQRLSFPATDYTTPQIDITILLAEESRFWPALAIGGRDLGNLTPYSSEYLVASKRWQEFDFTLGVGWGDLGRASDLNSPLGWISNQFDRRALSGSNDFRFDQAFRGPMALFGGLSYQTPWQRLKLLAEVTGASANAWNESQRTRLNMGARVALHPNVNLQAGWLFGEHASIGLNLKLDLERLQPRTPRASSQALPEMQQMKQDWNATAQGLETHAGLRVQQITRSGAQLRIDAEPVRYRALADSELLATELLAAVLPDDFERIHYRWSEHGLYQRTNVHDLRAQESPAARRPQPDIHSHGRAQQPPAREVLADRSGPTLAWFAQPEILQDFGSTDGYPLVASARLSGSWLGEHLGRVDSEMSLVIHDTLNAQPEHPDGLAPVRSQRDRYAATERLGLERLQYSLAGNPAAGWYLQGYGGLLETMFAGIGAEILYRPLGGRWALGIDVNRVRQRDFDRRLSLQDYDTWTGHLTSYLDTGIENLHTQISFGRFLAGDYGFTLDVSREFSSGARLGFWTTISNTDADDVQHGLRISVPFDAFFTDRSRHHAALGWQPLQQDAGARLDRRHSLYDMTLERQRGRYWRGFQSQ